MKSSLIKGHSERGQPGQCPSIHTPYTLEGNLPTKDSVLLYTLHTHWRATSLQRTVSFYTHSGTYKGQYTLHTHWRTTSLQRTVSYTHWRATSLQRTSIHTPYTLEGNLLQRTVSFYTHSIHIGGQPPYKGQCPSIHTPYTLEDNLPTKDSVLLYTLHTYWRTTSLQRTVPFYTHSIHIGGQPPTKDSVLLYTLHTHWRTTSLQRTVSFYTHSIHIEGQPPYKGQRPSIHTPYTTSLQMTIHTPYTLEDNLPTKDSVLLYTLHTHWRTISLQRTVSYTHSIHIGGQSPYKGQCPIHTPYTLESLNSLNYLAMLGCVTVS